MLYELRPGIIPTASQLSLSLEASRPDFPDCSCLLVLRGYPSAEWLNEIGSRYKIDPEYFHRHLDFLSSRQYANQRTTFTLPSSQSTILQLSLTSVGTQAFSAGTDITAQRSEAARKMETYLHYLKIGSIWQAGNSIVRSYAVHDRGEYSIEQLATVYVSTIDKAKGLWTGQ